jgi:hypothetical protein
MSAQATIPAHPFAIGSSHRAAAEITGRGYGRTHAAKRRTSSPSRRRQKGHPSNLGFEIVAPIRNDVDQRHRVILGELSISLPTRAATGVSTERDAPAAQPDGTSPQI